MHMGGRPCDIEDIYNYTKKIGIKLVEDACHSPLAEYYNKNKETYKIGSCKHSSAVALSLHPIKHFTSGEGGVVLTNDKSIYEKVKLLRSHHLVKNPDKFHDKKNVFKPWYYEINDLGYNYRLSEINSALAYSQLKRIKKSLHKREIIAKTYNKLLENIKGISIPEITSSKTGKHAWHLYSIKINFEYFAKKRSEVMKSLSKKGIGTQVHYIPLYRQKIFSSLINKNEFTGSEIYYKSTLSLPMYETLNKNDIIFITNCLLQILRS